MPAFGYVSLLLRPRDGESNSTSIPRRRLKAVADAVYIGVIFTDDLQALAASSD